MINKLSTIRLVFLIFLTGLLLKCIPHSQFNQTYVSESIKNRTGNVLRSGKNLKKIIPDKVSLTDGITEAEATAIALWNNARFQADLAALGFARADLIEAGLLQNPILSLLFPVGPKQLEATLSLPIDILWKRPKRVAIAKINQELVAENLVQNGLDLTRDVLIAYGDLIRAIEREKIFREESALQKEIAVIASARLKAGDISQLEETAFELEAVRIQELHSRSRRDLAGSWEKFKNLLGIGLSEIDLKLSPGPLSFPHPQKLSQLLTAAFASRPDLRGAELSIESAAKGIGLEQADIFKINAMLDANAEGKEGFETGPGIQFTLPVLNWNKGKIARARATLELKIRKYTVIKHRIVLEVKENHASMNGAADTLKILYQALPNAKRAVSDAREAYLLGEISYLQLLEFRRQYLKIRLQITEAEADLRRAMARLKHSIGFKPL